MYDAARLVASAPGIGHLRADLTKEAARFWTIPRLRITLVYDPSSEPLVVLQVVGPGQDTCRLFEP